MDFIATLKKDLYVAVISNGSATQKEKAIETAQKAFEWCVSHLGKAEDNAPVKRMGRPPKNADK